MYRRPEIWRLSSVAETRRLAARLGRLAAPDLIVALSGALGSGKTAFVQGLARGLGVATEYCVASPTYTVVSEYPGRLRLYHVDLYRLDTEDDLETVGFFDLLDAGGVVAIEWADKLDPRLLGEHLALHLEITGKNSRLLQGSAYGQTGWDLLSCLPKI
jgi:tRNA threonylcarbamoyladenosine biosynthesis protein TsaE